MRRTLRLPVALVAAVVVAEVAVLLLRPRDSGPEPVVVDARAYFSPAQLEKGQDFRRGQLALYGARLLIEGGVLILLVRRPPRRLRRDFRRPLVAAAVAGAVLSVTLGLAALPVSAISRERSKDVGLVTQGWADWAGDVAKGEAIGAVFAGAGGALLLFGMRRFGPRWWAPGAVVVVAFGIAFTYAGPVVLDPVFNDFTRLPAGPDPQRRARARSAVRAEGGGGLRGRRLAPHHRRQRLRHRAWARPSASSSTTTC